MSMEFPEPYKPDNTDGYELLPPGEYVAQAIEASIAPPKTGNGLALTLVWKILEGELENRQLWQNISFVHPKAGAQHHGQKMLNAVIAATGAPTPLQNAGPLLFVPCRLGIAIETDKNGFYDDKNRVVKVSPLDSNEAAEAASSPAPVPKPVSAPKPAGPAPSGSAPWHRSK
jgi:Protein of unknown function (DUF669)